MNPAAAARDMVAISPSLSIAATDPAGGDKIIYSGEEEVLIAVLERYVWSGCGVL